MDPVYGAEPVHSSERQVRIANETVAMRERLPLISPALRDWRPALRRAPKPRVSIVIPTYDRAQFLAPALACLTRQTFSEMEVVVIDDGSPNAAQVRAVAESFVPLVRFIRVGNAGEAAAVNRGLEAAQGEFVGFLSDDDAYAAELIEESVAALDAAPHSIGTYPDWDIVDTAGYVVEAHRLPEFDRALMLAAHWCLPGPGVIVRREVLLRVGGRDLTFRYVSDFDLWLRATRHGPMIHLSRKLAYWRLHASNLTTSTRRREMAAERIMVMRKLFMDPCEPTDPDLVRKAYAAAHAAAAAILGRDDAEEARKHLRAMSRLDPDLAANLPPNMTSYPQIWPSLEEARDPVGARNAHV
jgi:GT2 family glycosyltransferase